MQQGIQKKPIEERIVPLLEEQRDKLWTKGFVLLTICNLLLFLNLHMTLPSFSPYLKESFHADDFTVSLATSLFALSAIVTRFVAAGALQKGKRKTVLYIGLAIGTLSTAGYLWCGSITAILLMRIGSGVGFGMVSTLLPTIVSGLIPAKRMGEGIGYFGLSTSLSMSIAPLIGLSILGSYGFPALASSAVLALALIFPLALLSPSMRKEGPIQAGAAGDKVRIMDKSLLLPALLNLLLSVTYGGILSFLALFGKEMHISQIGGFFLVNALAMLVVRPFSGKLYDSKGPKASLIPGALLVIAGLTVLSFSASMVFVVLSAVLYGLGYGMIQPSIQAWMIGGVAPELRGMANGVFFNSMDLGIATGAMLLGSVAMRTGYSVMYQVSALFVVLFLIIAVRSRPRVPA